MADLLQTHNRWDHVVSHLQHLSSLLHALLLLFAIGRSLAWMFVSAAIFVVAIVGSVCQGTGKHVFAYSTVNRIVTQSIFISYRTPAKKAKVDYKVLIFLLHFYKLYAAVLWL